MRLPFTRRKPEPQPPKALPAAVNDSAAVDHSARLDAWMNRQTGLGTRESRSSCTSFVARGRSSDEMLDAVYEFSRLMARIVDLEPDTAMAKFFKVTELDDGQQVELEHYLMRLEAYAKIREAHSAARLYGGAVIVMRVIDGSADMREPLDLSRISSLTSLQVFAGDEVHVQEWNIEPASRFFGEPEIYSVSTFGASFEVHRSRVLHFDGTRSTRKAKRRGINRGFSTSVVDQVWDAFQAYGETREYGKEAISRLSQGVLKLGGFNDGMKGDSAGKFQNRLKMLLKSMSTMGDIVVDKDGDDYDIVNRTMSGYKDAADVFVDALVAESGIPRSILMQQQQAGLSSGDNSGDWKAWSGHIAGVQTSYLEPKIKQLLAVVFAARMSPVDHYGEYTITWHPVQEMTEAEKATILAQRAQARSLDVQAGVISTLEARRSEDVIEAYHIEDYGTAQAPIDDIGG